MKHSVKTCIAYVAGCAIQGEPTIRLHDNGKGEPVRVDGTVIEGKVDITHKKKGYHLTGPLSKFEDTEQGIRLSIEIDGHKFSGKDHGKGIKFKGKVKGNHISLNADGYASFSIL